MVGVDWTRVVEAILPDAGGEDALRARTGVVDSIASNGRADVVVSGIVVPSLPVIAGVEIAVGNTVMLISYRGQMVVLGKTRTSLNTTFPGNVTVSGGLTVAGDNINGVWTTRTPTFAQGITVGNGTFFVRWKRIGTTFIEIGRFTLGSTSSVSAGSQPVLNMPIPISSSDGVKIIGSASFFDSTTGRFLPGIIRAWTGTSVTFHGTNGNAMLAGNPFNWASGNALGWTITYEIAP